MSIVHIALVVAICAAAWGWALAKSRNREIAEQQIAYLQIEKELEQRLQESKRELDRARTYKVFFDKWQSAPYMKAELDDLRVEFERLASEQLSSDLQAALNRVGWGIVDDNGVDYAAKGREVRERAQRLVQEEKAVRSTDGSSVRKDGAACVLDAFNGYVNFYALKTGEMARRMQMVKAAFYLVNLRAEQALHLCITKEYLDVQLEFLQVQEEIAAYKSRKRAQDAETKRLEDAVQQQKAEIERKLDALRVKLEKAHAAEKARLEAQIAELEKKKRSISNAELTRKGTVYIISNVGSFGEDIYKIGMTRRTDPQERVDELGVASVPFPFDVHAFIPTNDAPKLETELHRIFRPNKVNMEAINGREFYHVKLDEIRKQAKLLGYRCDDWVESPQRTRYKGANPPAGVKVVSEVQKNEDTPQAEPDKPVQSKTLDQLRKELNENLKQESIIAEANDELQPQQNQENKASEFADELLIEIRQSGTEYDDSMIGKGGCLYLYDKGLANRLKQKGYAVSYAAHGTKHNNHRPVWYVKVN